MLSVEEKEKLNRLLNNISNLNVNERKELYTILIKTGADKIEAYKMVYNVSEEVAIEMFKMEEKIEKLKRYDLLREFGISDADAKLLVFGQYDDSNERSR